MWSTRHSPFLWPEHGGAGVSDSFLNGKVTLHRGDCLAVLPTLEENSLDGCVCDPPYHLTSIVKRFGAEGAAPCKEGKTGAYARASKGFMGKTWDGGDIAFRPEVWREVFRVLKPGAHLLAFGGTRTYHRMAVAIEDAGFEIRDCIAWLYGSGFPKSHDVSKGIDRLRGAEREVVQEGKPVKRMIPGADQHKGGWEKNNGREFVPTETRPATDEAAQWQGWGTALKPALEPIVLARKPLSEKSIAANVLEHGTGAINVDGCRVKTSDTLNGGAYSPSRTSRAMSPHGKGQRSTVVTASYEQPQGRWPANVIHDGSEEVLEAFPDAPGQQREVNETFAPKQGTAVYGDYGPRPTVKPRGDSGSSARFFYTAKADADDRLGSKHPTVKPVYLMQYLVRLIVPKGGTVLDLFAGTGTTGEAALRESRKAVLIEREPEYQADIERRMALALAGPDERARETLKAKGTADYDAGPLFTTNTTEDAA